MQVKGEFLLWEKVIGSRWLERTLIVIYDESLEAVTDAKNTMVH